jgi:hypothetical protein
LKVTGTGKSTTRIGKMHNNEKNYTIVVTNEEGDDTFRVSENGGVEIGGSLYIGPISDNKTVTGELTKVETSANEYADKASNSAKEEAINEANRLVNSLGDNVESVRQELQN